jgi:hypothetical protein
LIVTAATGGGAVEVAGGRGSVVGTAGGSASPPQAKKESKRNVRSWLIRMARSIAKRT